MDGRNHVEDLIRRREEDPGIEPFDVIIGDSINQFSVPFQLTTREFNEEIYALLSDTGIYLLNTTDRYDSGRFLGAVISTCREVFPYVYAFTCRPRDTDQHDSFVVVCAKEPVDMAPMPGRIRSRYPFYTGDLLTADEMDALVARAGHRVLTDNHAPVDNLVAGIETSQRVSAYQAKEDYARDVFTRAEASATSKQYAEALPKYEELVRLFPMNPQLRTALGGARRPAAPRRSAQALRGSPPLRPGVPGRPGQPRSPTGQYGAFRGSGGRLRAGGHGRPR
jgi:hypothetical protein